MVGENLLETEEYKFRLGRIGSVNEGLNVLYKTMVQWREAFGNFRKYLRS